MSLPWRATGSSFSLAVLSLLRAIIVDIARASTTSQSGSSANGSLRGTRACRSERRDPRPTTARWRGQSIARMPAIPCVRISTGVIYSADPCECQHEQGPAGSSRCPGGSQPVGDMRTSDASPSLGADASGAQPLDEASEAAARRTRRPPLRARGRRPHDDGIALCVAEGVNGGVGLETVPGESTEALPPPSLRGRAFYPLFPGLLDSFLPGRGYACAPSRIRRSAAWSRPVHPLVRPVPFRSPRIHA